MKSIIVCILLITATISISAQKDKNSVSTKVAMINSLAFYDEKSGIKKLAMAEKQMGMVDCAAMFEYSSLKAEIRKLEKEITELQCQKRSVDDKILQLQKSKDLSEQKLGENKTCKENFRLQTVEPIKATIREKLKEFAKLKGYGIVVDALTIVESESIIEGEVENLTAEFIKFCNDYFDKEKSQ